MIGENSNIACLDLGDDFHEYTMKFRIHRPSMMRAVRAVLVACIAMIFAGCTTPSTCEEPEFYEFAEGGKRIEAPDDLDNLGAHKEMVIPEASPRPPREPGSGCLDRPPTLRIDDDGTAVEVET